MPNENDFWSDYYTDLYYQQNPTPQPAKKTFWETGFGTGLSSLWKWATNNPQQVANLVGGNRVQNNQDLLQAGGWVGGEYRQGSNNQNNNNQDNNNQDNKNNSTTLIIIGVGVIVVLVLLFKN